MSSTKAPSTLMINGVSIDNPIIISHKPESRLTLEKLIAVSSGDDDGIIAAVALDPDSLELCKHSAEYIHKAVLKGQKVALKLDKLKEKDEKDYEEIKRSNRLNLIYGVNTGFGNNRDKPLESYLDACRISENLILSHAVGTGPALPTEVVRAAMLLRLQTFIYGYSGVRVQLIKMLADMLNRRVHPWVPSQGSVGSSGDLCPLSHIGLVILGLGEAWVEGDYPLYPGATWDDAKERRGATMPGGEALRRVGLNHLQPPDYLKNLSYKHPDKYKEVLLPKLAPKEGIALTNGTAVCTAITAIAVFDSLRLIHHANLAGAITLQAIGGITRSLESSLHGLRPHKGQVDCAAEITSLVEGSGLVNRSATAFQVQDDYSVRAMPQVHGSCLTAARHAREIIEVEINSVTDNPIILADMTDYDPLDKRMNEPVCNWQVYSGANFHGEQIGMAADYLKIAVSELANISERRVQLLLDPDHNRGLPANLAGEAGGINSGFMIFQYLAASLVAENKVLSHPSSVDSIPTSANTEDHVAMATNAARHLRQVIFNTAKTLSVELICSLQALEFRTTYAEKLKQVLGDDERWKRYKSLHDPGDRGEASLAIRKVLAFIRDKKDGLGIPFIDSDIDFIANPPYQMIDKMLRAVVESRMIVLLKGYFNRF